METFRRVGYTLFNGSALYGGHKLAPRRMTAYDEVTAKDVVLFTGQSDLEEWFAFTEVFMKDLYQHLQEKGWLAYYYQAVCDEPTDLENYKRAYALVKKCMPEVRTMEPCGNPDYSPYIDIQVFNMGLAKSSFQQLAKQRRAAGKGVWFYHCASPYPPYPNRHLDESLVRSRLYPWLVYHLNADGFLFWAANNYRLADPYKSSIGPLPGGVLNPGHPPGDDWMYYPGPQGLLGSLRMVTFRDGLLDYTLLSMLSEHDQAMAQTLLRRIIRTVLDFAEDPAAYHQVRKKLLQELDRYS